MITLFQKSKNCIESKLQIPTIGNQLKKPAYNRKLAFLKY